MNMVAKNPFVLHRRHLLGIEGLSPDEICGLLDLAEEYVELNRQIDKKRSSLRGRTLTSYPSIKTDIRNAGGNWVDEEVVVDEGLVSSRKPDDLPAFCAKIVEEYAEGAHDVAREGATAS